MFDLDGHGGTLQINGRPAGTLQAWAYGPGPDKALRVRADVVLHPLYKRLGIKEGSAATVVLDPRSAALRPARLTIDGIVGSYANGKITILHAKQIEAQIVAESGRAVARDLLARKRGTRS